MRQLFNSDMECLVESDFIYLPLLFDPEIEKEIQTTFQPDLNTIIKRENNYFVKALNLHSLIENYERINAYDYKHLRNNCLEKYQLNGSIDGIFLDETLRIILFQVMPYFIKKNKGLVRKKLSDEELLDLINHKIKIPDKYYKNAETFQDLESLQKIIASLKNQIPIFKPQGNGILTGRQLRDGFNGAVQAKILKSEYHGLTSALKIRKKFRQAKREHIATLLYIADAGSLEIDGFGFTRNNAHKEEFFIYKRTKEYILKDYYARSYLFPECRVAVSTYSPSRPLVMEKYKHPFLLGHKSRQEICIKDFIASNELSAKNVIRTLEEGLAALLYGYDGRRRNGYHSLDKTWVHIPTIDFEDYRL